MTSVEESCRIMKKLLIVFTVMIIIGTIIFFILAKRPNPGQMNSFILEELHRGNLEFTISSTGTLSAVGTVAVGAQVSGTIDKVLVGYNDIVKKGQLLAVLDKSMFLLAVEEGEMRLGRVRAIDTIPIARAIFGGCVDYVRSRHAAGDEGDKKAFVRGLVDALVHGVAKSSET